MLDIYTAQLWKRKLEGEKRHEKDIYQRTVVILRSIIKIAGECFDTAWRCCRWTVISETMEGCWNPVTQCGRYNQSVWFTRNQRRLDKERMQAVWTLQGSVSEPGETWKWRIIYSYFFMFFHNKLEISEDFQSSMWWRNCPHGQPGSCCPYKGRLIISNCL